MGLVDLGSNSTRLIQPLHSACYGESFLPRSCSVSTHHASVPNMRKK